MIFSTSIDSKFEWKIYLCSFIHETLPFICNQNCHRSQLLNQTQSLYFTILEFAEVVSVRGRNNGHIQRSPRAFCATFYSNNRMPLCLSLCPCSSTARSRLPGGFGMRTINIYERPSSEGWRKSRANGFYLVLLMRHETNGICTKLTCTRRILFPQPKSSD